MIELKEIERTFGKGEAKVQALNGVDLHIADGEMVAIVGPSGCGKTTLLNIVGCIDKPTGGTYTVDGVDVSRCTGKEQADMRNKRFGFVVQDFALIDEYTVYQNVMLPVKYNRDLSEKTMRPKALDLLKTLGIYEKRNTYPRKLSGGQKQRTAIARAIINDPNIILADEPTGALDQQNGQEIIRLFRQINRTGKTVVIVTHDMNVAGQCDRTVRMLDGRVVQA